MNHKFSFLSVTKPISQTPSLTDLEQTQLRDGFKLPQSYREFAVKFGFGLTCDFFYIFMPQGGCDDLANRSRDLHEVLLDGVFGNYKEFTEYEPHGSPDLLTKLVPFGTSKNGDILTWNPEETPFPEENQIYVVDAKLLAVWRAAPDLYSFLECCLDARIKDFLGSGYQPLPATFEPL